jgi:ATP-binding cassette subfamily F protein uup
VREYVGGYQDWLRQGGSPRLLGVGESKAGKPELASAVVAAPVVAAEPVVAVETPKKKLSYKLQRELEAIPAQIDAAELNIAELQAQIADAGFYQQPADKTAAVLAALQSAQEGLDQLVERWAELEG